MKIPIDLSGLADKAVQQVANELPDRAVRASNELRNAVMEVLSGPRSGRVYKKPGTYGKRMSKQTKSLLSDYGKKLRGGQLYRASAPGEPPAWRTGTLARSWRGVTYGENSQNPAVESEISYAWLDEGSPGGMIKPRPYFQKTIETAMPEVEKIYSEPFDFDL